MSETAEETEEEKPEKRYDPTPENKRKVGYRIKMALLEVIERKRITERVDYKAIGRRHGVGHVGLRKYYSLWTKNCIDLGEPSTPQEQAIDARMQHEKTIALLKRYKGLVLHAFEGALFKAEDALTNGKTNSYKEEGLPAFVKELEIVIRLQAYNEKGYSSILEEMMALKQREERKLPNDPVIETKILTANDENLALAILKSAHADAHRVPEPAAASVSPQNGSGDRVDAGGESPAS